MDVSSKLQLEPGQSVAVLNPPPGLGGQRGTDLNRDRLAAALAGHGVQPVRQVSIDDTWSALRLRPAKQ